MIDLSRRSDRFGHTAVEVCAKTLAACHIRRLAITAAFTRGDDSGSNRASRQWFSIWTQRSASYSCRPTARVGCVVAASAATLSDAFRGILVRVCKPSIGRHNFAVSAAETEYTSCRMNLPCIWRLTYTVTVCVQAASRRIRRDVFRGGGLLHLSTLSEVKKNKYTNIATNIGKILNIFLPNCI